MTPAKGGAYPPTGVRNRLKPRKTKDVDPAGPSRPTRQSGSLTGSFALCNGAGRARGFTQRIAMLKFRCNSCGKSIVRG